MCQGHVGPLGQSFPLDTSSVEKRPDGIGALHLVLYEVCPQALESGSKGCPVAVNLVVYLGQIEALSRLLSVFLCPLVFIVKT